MTGSVYEPLSEYLSNQADPVVRMTFAEIERVLGRPLPLSARKYPAWWANEEAGSHSHARSWLDARRKTRGLDLNATTVEFVR
jgi:hypothetical protein